jgi:hypothetical protein
MNVTSAKYLKPLNDDGSIVDGSDNTSILAVIDGVTMQIPVNEDNRHYKEIMELVEAGELTIADAE